MKPRLLFASLVATLVFGACSVQAASFAYHGTLQDSGKPAEGSYDIELTLYSALSGGSVIGGPLVMYNVPVYGGSFNTEADFGPLSQSFTHAYVGVKVRSAGQGEFAALDARAPMSVAVTTSVCPGAWTLGGNSGNPAGSYLGTADSQPLTFEVNGTVVGQFTLSSDATTLTPNVVFGSAENTVASGIGGATIAGGGDIVGNYGANSVQASFAAVVGGTNNTASGPLSTVAGGRNNLAYGFASAVPGGQSNQAGGGDSFAAGAAAVVRNGDNGTFVWADGSNFPASFTSTGPDQFLIQSIGGVGINTNAPFANTLTVAGSSGSVSYTPTPHTAAVFENNGITFVEVASPATDENGVLFSLTGSITSMTADGGIVYNDIGGGYPNGLELRTGGNHTRVAITGAGETLNISGAWTKFSDIRLKRDIAPIDHPLDTFLGLHGRTFEYIDPIESMATSGRHMGFIAQDVEHVLPQWVSEDARGYKMVTPSGFDALTVEAMRALRDEKDGEIAALRSQLDDVLARLSKLENKRGE